MHPTMGCGRNMSRACVYAPAEECASALSAVPKAS